MIRICGRLTNQGNSDDRAWYRYVDYAAFGLLCSNSFEDAEQTFYRNPASKEEARQSDEGIQAVYPMLTPK